MRNVVEKLFVSSQDLVAAVDVTDDYTLEDLHKTSKTLVGAGVFGRRGFEGMKNVKIVKGPRQLDDSVFSKVVAKYNDDLNLKSLVRICDNKGLVLITSLPEDKVSEFEGLLADKAGVFETWTLASDKPNCSDFLFKVRK